VLPPNKKIAHILEKLLERGHKVVTTVRSEDKAQRIRDAHSDLGDSTLKVVIVPDIAQEDAFDEVVKEPGLEVVLHTASPFHYNWCMFPAPPPPFTPSLEGMIIIPVPKQPILRKNSSTPP